MRGSGFSLGINLNRLEPKLPPKRPIQKVSIETGFRERRNQAGSTLPTPRDERVLLVPLMCMDNPGPRGAVQKSPQQKFCDPGLCVCQILRGSDTSHPSRAGIGGGLRRYQGGVRHPLGTSQPRRRPMRAETSALAAPDSPRAAIAESWFHLNMDGLKRIPRPIVRTGRTSYFPARVRG